MWPVCFVHHAPVAILPCGQVQMFCSHSCVTLERWRCSSWHEVHLVAPFAGHAAPAAAGPKLPGHKHFFSAHVEGPAGR